MKCTSIELNLLPTVSFTFGFENEKIKERNVNSSCF